MAHYGPLAISLNFSCIQNVNYYGILIGMGMVIAILILCMILIEGLLCGCHKFELWSARLRCGDEGTTGREDDGTNFVTKFCMCACFCMCVNGVAM